MLSLVQKVFNLVGDVVHERVYLSVRAELESLFNRLVRPDRVLVVELVHVVRVEQ